MMLIHSRFSGYNPGSRKWQNVCRGERRGLLCRELYILVCRRGHAVVWLHNTVFYRQLKLIYHAGTSWRLWNHHSLEFPSRNDYKKGCACHRSRMRRCDQASERNTFHGSSFGKTGRAVRTVSRHHACLSDERPHRGDRACHSSSRTEDQLHRLNWRGQNAGQACSADCKESKPGARWQCTFHRFRRCRCRSGCGRCHILQISMFWTDLRLVSP